jgi:TonB family protein
VALHFLALLWLLRAPTPAFLAPTLLAHGNNGEYITHLYWPDQSADTANDSSSSGGGVSHSRPASRRESLTFQPKDKAAQKKNARPLRSPQAETDDRTASAQPHQPLPAGSPYGTVLEGPLSGYEVRPALPVFSPDPVVDTADLAGAEGDEVIEVTIDEHGNIVQKTIVQSLGPTVDTKVLAALASWQFRPATRNGVPIPSKQDVYYHFPPLHRG